MIDVDHFKSVNDRHGHNVGDVVLKGVAQVLSAGVRATDIVARFGGEEMIVVLPHTDGNGAMIVTERLRTRLAGAVHSADGKPLSVTASLGLATAPMGEKWPAALDLVCCADRALYEAKAFGRNRVVAWDASMKVV